jgi:phosphatidate cytidylyltransferase
MLQTRLWTGTALVVVTAGMLFVDQSLAPWYPFLFVFVVGLSLAVCAELVGLLGERRKPQVAMLYVGTVLLEASIWCVQVPRQYGWQVNPWAWLLGIFVTLITAVFLCEMVTFQIREGPSSESGSIERMARTIWALAYLGLLPCFLAQVRWLYPASQPECGSVALGLIIFVPKCCDIGAYCTGRLLGRHPMTPVLSPKKTWEGAVGGLTLGTLTAVGIDRLGPVALLKDSLGCEIGFGITLSIAGMFGDLAESLVKRDCSRKDAAAVVPGFGGVLDVVDAVIFAAPVGYLWLWSLA